MAETKTICCDKQEANTIINRYGHFRWQVSSISTAYGRTSINFKRDISNEEYLKIKEYEQDFFELTKEFDSKKDALKLKKPNALGLLIPGWIILIVGTLQTSFFILRIRLMFQFIITRWLYLIVLIPLIIGAILILKGNAKQKEGTIVLFNISELEKEYNNKIRDIISQMEARASE